GFPLINYDAVYPAGAKYPSGKPIPEGTPVLNMLRTVPRRLLYDQALPGDRSYQREVDDLEGGIIPGRLRDLFTRLKIPLSPSATVTDEDGFAWRIVSDAQAYLVVAVEAQGDYRLRISTADLELVHTDLTAIITGPNANRFPYTNTSPTFRINPA